MSLSVDGIHNSACEITNIDEFGFWILIEDKEYFVFFSDYPMFRDKTINQILSVEYFAPNHLFWEELDIDIEIDALKNPEEYPLLFHE